LDTVWVCLVGDLDETVVIRREDCAPAVPGEKGVCGTGAPGFAVPVDEQLNYRLPDPGLTVARLLVEILGHRVERLVGENIEVRRSGPSGDMLSQFHTARKTLTVTDFGGVVQKARKNT